MNKICDQCGEGGPIESFVPNRGKFRGRHKKCGVLVNIRRWYEKKAKKNPHGVFACDDCENLFSVLMSTHHPEYKKGAKHSCCPKCGSEEIQTFAELEGIKKAR